MDELEKKKNIKTQLLIPGEKKSEFSTGLV